MGVGAGGAADRGMGAQRGPAEGGAGAAVEDVVTGGAGESIESNLSGDVGPVIRRPENVVIQVRRPGGQRPVVGEGSVIGVAAQVGGVEGVVVDFCAA